MKICNRCGDELRWRLGFYPSVVAIDPVITPILTCLLCPEVAAAQLEDDEGSRLMANWGKDPVRNTS